MKSLSSSKISTYESCPKMFEFQYVKNMLPMPSDALLIGQLVHLAIENFHSNNDPYEEVKKKLLKEMTDENIKLFGIIRRMVDAYIKKPIKLETVELEKKFDIPLINSKGNKLPINITGRLDRLTKRGIIEYKTSNKPYTQEDVDDSLQASIYAYAYNYLKKKMGEIIFCVMNKKEKSQDKIIQKLTTKRTKKDFDELYDRILDIHNRIEIKDFESNPSSICFWCGYRDICEDSISKK